MANATTSKGLLSGGSMGQDNGTHSVIQFQTERHGLLPKGSVSTRKSFIYNNKYRRTIRDKGPSIPLTQE